MGESKETAITERRHPYDHPANIAAERAFYEATNADRRSTSVQQNGSSPT